jgi:uncharacterized protein with von Willebrand factor type A (vWA) domain
MDREELLGLLDLEGAEDPVPAPTADPLTSPPASGAPGTPPAANPNALEIDDWALRRGADLLAELDDLARRGLDDHAMADFHTAAFAPEARLMPDCADRLRHRFLAQLLETPEYHALHATTMLHEAAAALAAVRYAEQFADLRDERREKEGPPPPERKARDAAAAPDAPDDEEIAVVRAVCKALAEAGADVEGCMEIAAAGGLGPGAPGSNDPKAIAALFRRVRASPTLRRIAELAGRYRRVAQSKQRRKATHGLDDVVGVELGGDIGRLLPGELARLVLPECELDALRRIAERSALCREHHATEPVGKGPILVTVDESGSMAGEKVHTAKALALALAWIARQQRRWCGLVAYSGDTGERLLPLPPGRWDEQALASWLEAFLGGGSSLDVPVRELPRHYEELKAPRGDTDVILVTDAVCRIPPEDRDAFLAWKHRVKARVITLVIGSEAGDLAEISDEVHELPSLATTEAAVERVLSL